MSANSPVRVAEVVRSGFVEGHHYGSVIALAADGSVDWSVGDVTSPVFPRSSNKPLQAVGMLRVGLDLDGELLALVGASHSGEPFHLEAVRKILAIAGLDESALQTPAEYPLDDQARDEWVRRGAGPSPLAMNCSGKHAGMLATSVAAGWPVETYLETTHPVQKAIRDGVESLTGERAVEGAVDGCGAPLLSTSLLGLARAFATLACAAADSAEGRVVRAFSRHPVYASGTRRDEAALLEAFPGAIAKAGAESCYVVALPDGRSFALKIDDGAARARPVVMAAALRRSGITHPVLDEIGRHLLYGGHEPVGGIRATIEPGVRPG